MLIDAAGYDLRDGENNAVHFHCACPVKSRPPDEIIAGLLDKFGDALRLLPVSAASCGDGLLGISPNGAGVAATARIVALHVLPVARPQIRVVSDAPDIRAVRWHEIIIDPARRHIYAGAAVTLAQINTALEQCPALSEQGVHHVYGADLTSSGYAQAGSTFMTGGMGPQRRYFSDSVDQVALHDGTALQTIEGARLLEYAGSYGWTGWVGAVRCRYHPRPGNEFAFALPVRNCARELAAALSAVSPFCYFDDHPDTGINIFGVEHLTAHAMEPLLQAGGRAEIISRARRITENCSAAQADGLLFISGFSDLPATDTLAEIVDRMAKDTAPSTQTLAYSEVFESAALMQALREAVPYAARRQLPKRNGIYKNHTDANVILKPDRVGEAMQRIWNINENYVQALQDIFINSHAVDGSILIYGHLNPRGVDPHNRLTLAAPDKKSLGYAVMAAEAARGEYFKSLRSLCDEGLADYAGGEKSAGSEAEMIKVFGEDALPPMLAKKYSRQISRIRHSSPLFNWRAIPPYSGDFYH